jgi:uncharacterized membrane protein
MLLWARSFGCLGVAFFYVIGFVIGFFIGLQWIVVGIAVRFFVMELDAALCDNLAAQLRRQLGEEEAASGR